MQVYDVNRIGPPEVFTAFQDGKRTRLFRGLGAVGPSAGPLPRSVAVDNFERRDPRPPRTRMR